MSSLVDFNTGDNMSSIIAMCAFSLAMSVSPGPVNLITLAIGVNRGLREAIPFVSGATIGFTLLLMLVGLGLGELAVRFSPLLNGTNYVGAAIIFFMGYKIATSSSQIELIDDAAPTFLQGFLLQWLNPKAWAACLAGIVAFNAADSYSTLFLFSGLYFTICYVSIGSWAFVGEKAFKVFQTPARLRLFNIFMGVGLIVVAIVISIQNISR